MAKAKRSVRRDLSPITTRRVSDSRPVFSSVSQARPREFPRPRPHFYPWPQDPVFDARVFSPSRKRVPVTFFGSPARVVSPPLPKRRVAPSATLSRPVFQSLPARLLFDQPKRVVLCVRRKVRREVILATGYGGAQKRGKRTQYSNVRC